MSMISPLDRGEPPPDSVRLDGFGWGLRAGCESPDRCNDFGGCIVFENPTQTTLERVTAALRKLPAVNLKHLEDELTRSRLNEIATLVRALTYGEMIEFAGALWKAKGEGEITGETLAGVMHRWSQKP